MWKVLRNSKWCLERSHVGPQDFSPGRCMQFMSRQPHHLKEKKERCKRQEGCPKASSVLCSGDRVRHAVLQGGCFCCCVCNSDSLQVVLSSPPVQPSWVCPEEPHRYPIPGVASDMCTVNSGWRCYIRYTAWSWLQSRRWQPSGLVIVTEHDWICS